MRNPFLALFDRRSVSSSAELMDLLTAGRKSLAGPSVTEATAFNVSTVMTCVSLISRTIASLPLQVYERGASADRRDKAPTHPLMRALRKPNPWQTPFDFFQMMQTHLLLRGNAYAWINWTAASSDIGEQVAELIPLHPDRVQVTQDPDWTVHYKISRKIGAAVDIPADEILHLRSLSTDGVVGRSTLTDAREMLGGALATQEYASNFWAGDATPTVVLKYPKALSDKARENIETSFAATYGRGADKRRVAVLEEGMDLTPVTLNAQDSQFLETRKFQRSEIAGWFHVPPHMIGDTEKATSWGTGIEQQQIGFLTFTIGPWLKAWEQRLDESLVKNTARFYCRFTLEGWLRGDVNSRYMAYARGIQNGWLSPNDVRRLEDMNPIEKGDTYLVPTNMTPLSLVEDLVNTQVQKAIAEVPHAS